MGHDGAGIVLQDPMCRFGKGGQKHIAPREAPDFPITDNEVRNLITFSSRGVSFCNGDFGVACAESFRRADLLCA